MAYCLTPIACDLLLPVLPYLPVYGLVHLGMAEQVPEQLLPPLMPPLQKQGVVSAVALKILPFRPCQSCCLVCTGRCSVFHQGCGTAGGSGCNSTPSSGKPIPPA